MRGEDAAKVVYEATLKERRPHAPLQATPSLAWQARLGAAQHAPLDAHDSCPPPRRPPPRLPPQELQAFGQQLEASAAAKGGAKR